MAVIKKNYRQSVISGILEDYTFLLASNGICFSSML